MKVICLVGNSQSHTQEVFSHLLNSGVAPALPSKRDQDININVWHDQAIGSRLEKTKAPKIGKLWEQMAVDIFLANHKQEIWCWSHEYSLRIAEYWLAFDSGIHLLLVYTPYEDYVSERITSSSITKEAISESLDFWRSQSQLLLDLHEAYPERTTIVSSKTQYDDFLSSLNADLKTPLKLDSEWSIPHIDDRILEHLLRSYAHAQPEILDIKNRASKHTITSNSEDKLYDVIASYLDTKQDTGSAIDSTPQQTMLSTDITNQPQIDHISELESEIDLLLAQLHDIQESYDDHLNASAELQKKHEKNEDRLNVLLEKHPDYWEAEDIATDYSPRDQSLHWQITNTYLKNSRFEKLEFQTNITDEGVELFIPKGTDESLLSKWMSTSNRELIISCSKNSPEQVSALNSLGASEWEVLKFLISRIIGYLRSKSAPKEIKTNFKNKIIAAFGKLQQELENWPLVLRYDSVDLIDTVHIGEYQALGIKLKNLQLGDLKLSSFNFRLATFNEAGQPFGAHPRLEFPESCKRILKSWFPESVDERGARLELRFSKPNQMDTNIWDRFEGSEQIFIAALIVNLKSQLHTIKQNNPKISIQWAEWVEVINFMKLTLSRVHASRNR